jgi:putative FmdB family regulatory protein
MPLHEYLCQDCQTRFESLISAARADQVACPACHSLGTRRLISVIAGVGGRTDFGAAGYAPAPSGGCCGGAGGCACGR